MTWSVGALEALQKQGWAREFDLEAFKDDALAYADDRIKSQGAAEPKFKCYTKELLCVTSREGICTSKPSRVVYIPLFFGRLATEEVRESHGAS